MTVDDILKNHAVYKQSIAVYVMERTGGLDADVKAYLDGTFMLTWYLDEGRIWVQVKEDGALRACGGRFYFENGVGFMLSVDLLTDAYRDAIILVLKNNGYTCNERAD